LLAHVASQQRIAMPFCNLFSIECIQMSVSAVKVLLAGNGGHCPLASFILMNVAADCVQLNVQFALDIQSVSQHLMLWTSVR
jgi:hypothetical protein